MTPVLVMGAGSWGTALAILLARNGYPTYLWAHDPAHVAAMRHDGRNARYLPQHPFPSGLVPISDWPELPVACTDVLFAVPLKALRSVAVKLTGLRPAWRIAWACKGVETGSRLLAHEVLTQCLGSRPMAVVSGPSFAAEVAAGLPTAVTVAAADLEFAKHWATRLHGGGFRTYISDDVVGVEIGGALKNVLAIAAGVADGLQFGANTRAALITRGLAEMIRLGAVLGGRRDTFMGLAGLGDLVLTCTDDQSRNRRIGIALGRGTGLEEASARIGQVAEGVATAREVQALAQQHGIEMPITEQVVRVLNGECSPLEAVKALLAREPKQETF